LKEALLKTLEGKKVEKCAFIFQQVALYLPLCEWPGGDDAG